MSRENTSLSKEPTPKLGEASGAANRRRRFRTPCRLLVMVYLSVLHGLLVAAIWNPAAIQRVKKFVFQTQESQGEYRGMVAAQSEATKTMVDGTAIFLGDSRMRDLDVTSVADQPVMNLSIGGDTTEGLLYRIPHYHRLDRCRLVVLGAGVNDFSHFNDDVILRNYDRILFELNRVGVRRIFVCSILPVATNYLQANSAWIRGRRTDNARITAVNDQIRSLCLRHSSTDYVNLTEILADKEGNLRSDFSSDGLHLNSAGNLVWAESLRRHLSLKN